jgi:hypothetical protein
LIQRSHPVAERGEMNGIASLAFRQAQHRPGRNLRRHFRRERIGRLAIKVTGGCVTVVPGGGIHVQFRC